MNPGYAGRAELPENLKALFRPCAMVTPNFENIAEVNLAGEGFVESKVLANKFTAMFLVCKELLSKQMHYDWGLRAMSVRGPYPALLLLLLSNPSRRAARTLLIFLSPPFLVSINSLGRVCFASPVA